MDADLSPKILNAHGSGDVLINRFPSDCEYRLGERMVLKKFCGKQGCSNLLTDGGYCEDHKQEAYAHDKYRGTATERGYDGRWRKARALYLKRNPLCVHCLRDGRVTPAIAVDHIIPHRGDKDLFWDMSNWQALCTRHHNSKTGSGQ
jgi:5-methylcytosine-specific restriction protein A